MSQNPNSGDGTTAQGSQGQQSQQGTAQGQQVQNAQQGSGQGAPQNRSRQRQNQPDTAEEVGSWFTETIVRAGVLVIGVAVLLFAIGQAVGANLLEPLVEFFTSGTGVWFVVAFIALLVMVAATKSWRTVN